MRILLLLFIIVSLVSGCVEEFNLNPENSEPRLVVDGLVTNQPGSYYVRLTKSKTSEFVSQGYIGSDNAEPVLDALVIISDDFNHTDTLTLQDSLEYGYNRGFYKTSGLKGVPGHSYILKVIYNGKTYRATAYMPPVPAIDSLGYEKKVSEKDGQEYYVPLLYFKEPRDTGNFYLIQLVKEKASRLTTAYSLWQFSVISDAFLKPYVNGLNINLGASPSGIEYPVFWEGDSVYVALSSLTENAYNYYKALMDQFENDGGVYKPAPSSPPSDINNGGLGYFRASAVSEAKTKIN